MNVLVANFKGGVGKTATAIQYAVPYVFEHRDHDDQLVAMLDFDILNHESDAYQSKIFEALSPEIEDDIYKYLGYLEERDCVIDVGGNTGTETLLNTMVKYDSMSLLDLILIPLDDGKKSAICAADTYSFIRDFNKDTPVLFVLSRVRNSRLIDRQFINWFGDKTSLLWDIKGQIEYVAKEDRGYIEMMHCQELQYAPLLKTTVYEIAKGLYEDKPYIEQKTKDGKVKKIEPETSKLKDHQRDFGMFKKGCESFLRFDMQQAFDKMTEAISRGKKQ